MIPWSLSLITPATALPLTAEEAQAHARIDCATPADQADSAIKFAAAVQDRERFTRRQFMPATWELWLNVWPCDGVIPIPKPPLISITSVKYVDQDGAEQTFPDTDYMVVAPAGPAAQHGYVALGYGKAWPSARYQRASIKVRFQAGYASAADVPAQLKQAVLLVFGEMYDHREDQALDAAALRAADRLCWPYRAFVSMPEETV